MIITITENYAAGHVGALLPSASLMDIQPIRDRELLRVGGTVTLIAGAAVAVSLLGIPSVTAAVVISAVGVLGLLVFFGSQWHRYLPIAEFFKPGP
ncbi:hypothetical protein SALCHL_003458 [Streptomyces albus subsp. chlorinus]|uniref:hypothetical protein n=1 Tax=Streptomyces albus TaxID=1888 RepID=UPI001FAB5593|nr:hypothetical protein [Streptomyces albus]